MLSLNSSGALGVDQLETLDRGLRVGRRHLRQSVGTVRGAGPLDSTTCTVVPGSTTEPATNSG